MARRTRAPASKTRVRKAARKRPRGFDSNRARKMGRKIPRQEIPTPRGRPYVPIHRTYTPELLANGRRRYEETPEPVAAIAVDFRIHPGSLRRLAGLLGWVRFAMGPRELPAASRLLAQAEELERLAAGSPPPERGRSPSQRVRAERGPMTGSARWVGVGANAEMTPTLTLPLAGGGNGEAGAGEKIAATSTNILDHLEREVRAELASVTALREQLKGLPRRPRDGESTARTLSTLSEVLQKIHRMRCGLTSPDNDDDDPPLIALEDEMCDFGLDGLSGGRSPDRLDALVWAVTELTARGGGQGPRVRGFSDLPVVPRGILRPSY